MSAQFGTRAFPPYVDGTANLAQAAGSYTLWTASGDVLIERMAFLVTTAATLLTSVAVTNSETTVLPYLSAANGALAALLAGASLAPYQGPTILRSGKLIQYTLLGLTGTGVMRVVAVWRPLTAGASLA